MPITLLNTPSEILLHIFSFLDLPDLEALTRASQALAALTSDPVLHQQRLQIVSPSRVNHGLFRTSPEGHALRPTVGDLVHRGVIQGLGIERRWRMGSYLYTLTSIKQYEHGKAIARRHASHVLTLQLKRRVQDASSSKSPLESLLSAHVLPHSEYSSPKLARSLLSTVHRLKWSIQKDNLARVIKTHMFASEVGFGTWAEKDGRHVVKEGEKVRLAICPDIRKRVGFFEALGKAA